MGIKATFTMQQIDAELARRAREIDIAIIRRLQLLGERCLIEARTNYTYTDQTGNLTSSKGYLIIGNGRIYQTTGFEPVEPGSSTLGAVVMERREGGKIGEDLAKEVAKEYTSGYALIVVAGMNYAAHVEARGYNVLASAELLAEKELPRMLAALSRNIEKMQ